MRESERDVPFLLEIGRDADLPLGAGGGLHGKFRVERTFGREPGIPERVESLLALVVGGEAANWCEKPQELRSFLPEVCVAGRQSVGVIGLHEIKT